MAGTDEEEWEYEYADTETEDFYITLDLSNTPAAGSLNVRSGQRYGNPTKLQSRLRALNVARQDFADSAEDSTNGRQLSAVGEMHITGLHTPNPLIMYNDQLLSCKWASTIGTDLFFVKPCAETELPTRPLRSLPAVDLLATSSAKLTANVAVLRPRDELSMQTQSNEEAAVNVMEPIRSAPTGFLAKLNQANAKRGEKSMLAISKTPNGTHIVMESATVEGSEKEAI
ncbi:hypothetical protein K504DRAFT_480591 [Pleomassaria siparia CBS 279.74]|uniref:Transcription factor TFIIIC triple barrel domain-containing protein n=1 Tax=Pleomassaria siparia CBS 279.74 TaxID=1314801 RepID=A0A6G1KFL4_9PLEO|nr:hypothetical protein K504DRAFT_480591 [Pleomassaria siparia CBS 279.74]